MNILKLGLVPQILIGVVLGAVVGVLLPGVAENLGILGQLFVGMLKAVAPLLVLVLVMSAIANKHETGNDGRKTMAAIVLYLVGTICAALVALLMSQLFPQTITLTDVAQGSPPVDVTAVLTTVLFQLIDNPVNALLQGNFLGCLTWAILLGVSFRKASDSFKAHLQTVADGVSNIVRYVIRLAPIGIFGLVCYTVATVGLAALASYASLAILLVSAMLVMALVVNPAIVFVITGSNPYPVIFRCLEESGVTAFFHPQFRGEYSGKPQSGQKTGYQRRALHGDDPHRCDSQYGRRGHHHYSPHSGGGQYAGYRGLFRHGAGVVRDRRPVRLRRQRRTIGQPVADTPGLFPVWYIAGCGHAGGGGGLYHQCHPGLHRNRPEFKYRRGLHLRGRSVGQ